MDVSIITSLYNRLDLTRVWLKSLEETLVRWQYEVILVDDGSTDGTREFIAALSDPRYRIVLNDTPKGFAVNNNAAAQMASSRLLCLLNNDTVLSPGWLEPMARLVQWDRRAALVGNVQRETVSGLIDHIGVYFSLKDGRPLHAGKNRATYSPPDPYTAWPAVTAACCVVRRAVFEEFQGFDEGYRNGFEDIDLCLRAGEKGFRHFVANRSVIYHHVSASPNRRLHEDANLARFRQRWSGRVPLGVPPVAEMNDIREEGKRYLRKHLRTPWKYNIGRLRRALGQRFRRAPAKQRVRLPQRWVLNLLDLVSRPHSNFPVGEVTPNVFLVVTDTVRNPSRSGIQTVVRCLAAAFGKAEVPARTVVWNSDAESLDLLPPTFSAGLAAEPLRSATAGGHPLHRISVAPGSWVLMPELMYDGAAARLVDYVHRHGWRLAVIFHDAISVFHPEFVPASLPARHEQYMREFTRADLVLPVSEASARDWQSFTAAHALPQTRVTTCVLASDLSATRRVRAEELETNAAKAATTNIRVLCVSTIEPRKNHLALFAAYELTVAARPDIRLELSLVGAPYQGNEPLAEQVREFVARHPEDVTWYEQIEYSLLRRLYEAADFTVYPSVLEGFGLPVIESMWFGRPCICANFGVMAENAAGGGCLTVDVRDPAALAAGILSLIASPDLRHKLATEATMRPLKTWDEYAAEVLGHLHEV